MSQTITNYKLNLQNYRMHRNTSILNSNGNMQVPNMSNSFIYPACDSMKSISDCPTLASEVDIMEGNYHHQSKQELQASSRKQQGNSRIHFSARNPNSKKNKILLVQSRLIEPTKIGEKDKLQNQISELHLIQEKTERLVAKQRQQRKQLAKLKKLYMLKEQELCKQQERLTTETTSLKQQIHELAQENRKLAKQKEQINSTISELQLQSKKTQLQISHYKAEREDLINQIQLLQINFNHDASTPRLQQNGHKDIDQQIELINSLIKTKRIEQTNHQQIQQLLQIKIQLLEQRQRSKLKQQRQKYQNKITQLNQCVIRRNLLIQQKNILIQKSMISKPGYMEEKQILLQTSDSFFQSSEQPCNNIYADQLAKNEELREELRQIIESYCVVGYEQSYSAIQTITLGMNTLHQSKSINNQDLINLIDITLQGLNNKLVSKAKHKINRIQNIIKVQPKVE